MSDELKNNEQLYDDDSASHDFDGIKELNNKAPLWIVIVFIVTIGFSGIYAIQYFGHPDNGLDQTSEYNKKVSAFAEEKKAMLGASAGSDSLSNEEMKAAGEKLYLEKGCIACHGIKGEGNQIGPNLTDNFWINGCKPEDVIHTITEGRPEKGMTPYKAMMSENQIKNISAYILHSLLGSNPENGKAAQGVECSGL